MEFSLKFPGICDVYYKGERVEQMSENDVFGVTKFFPKRQSIFDVKAGEDETEVVWFDTIMITNLVATQPKVNFDIFMKFSCDYHHASSSSHKILLSE
jgi:hypothetical protein